MHGVTQHRSGWVDRLAELSGEFGADADGMMQELRTEIQGHPPVLLDHLRLCGAIPESYGHDSSQEKLYSKYTDAVISEALKAIGLNSVVLETRADSADVQAHAPSGYSLVADAKAFRLSRTAKNQKDFKVQAMDGWRHNLDHALIVCPIYQLPIRTSQIYQQAIVRDVCIASFSHLAALVAFSQRRSTTMATSALHHVLNATVAMNPSKSAQYYWSGVNRVLMDCLDSDIDLWQTEKRESERALEILKRESISHIVAERDKVLAMSHEEALAELVRVKRFDMRMDYIRRVRHGTLLEHL
ncbi:MAG: HindIII family type II restriction endonuclease [Gemmatimonadota bacterium]|nr:HindIII family type II restriction endonuclease [Gemmatimonadota bacterium]